MGVSGFLDLVRDAPRATSAQAAVRWAVISSVTSSSVTTKPRTCSSTCSAVTRVEEDPRVMAALQPDLRLVAPVGKAPQRLLEQLAELGHDVGQLLADMLVQLGREQVAGQPIGQGNAPLLIEPDHPGRDSGEHGLGEAMAAIELVVGLDDQARRGCASIWLVMRLKARLSVPSSSLAGASLTRAERSPERTRSAVSISAAIGRASLVAISSPTHVAASSSNSATMTPASREGDLQPGSLRLDLLVIGDGAPGLLDMGDHHGIDRAADIEVGVGEAIEPQQRAHAIVIGARQDHHGAVARFRHDVDRDRLELQQAEIEARSARGCRHWW